MLIIHNMYFPHGYQYTYIYFREGVKAVAGGWIEKYFTRVCEWLWEFYRAKLAFV